MAKVKTAFLPTMEPPSYPELDAAALEYHNLKNQHKELTEQLKKAKDKVIVCMVERKLKKYETPDDLEVTREHESVDTIHVKTKPGAAGNGELEEPTEEEAEDA